MLLGLLFLLSPPTAPAPDPPPDVVVVVADDLALSDLDAIPTPNLDFLASHGVSFRRAYSHPLCSPTRRSIVFGRWPGVHVRKSCAPALATAPHHSEFSLGKLMKGAGLATGVFGKWHAGTNTITAWEASPQLHGFDVWRAGLPANVVNCGGKGYERWLRVDDGVSALTNEYQTLAVRDAFVDWWEETRGPRFAYVCFQAPHSPFHTPPPSALDDPTPPGGPAFVRGNYELMVQSVDVMVGDMLTYVDIRDTVFVFLADNGTPSKAIREDQEAGKVKGTTFEDGVRVPMIFAGPGIAVGEETDALVHTVDLLATLGDLVGAPPPAHLGLDSRSFAATLSEPHGARSARPYVFCENLTPGLPHDRAVVTERWKLRDVDGSQELYDLRNDPGEERPIAFGTGGPDLHELLGRLRALLHHP